MAYSSIQEEIDELRKQLEVCTVAAKEMALMRKIRQLEEQLQNGQN